MPFSYLAEPDPPPAASTAHDQTYFQSYPLSSAPHQESYASHAYPGIEQQYAVYNYDLHASTLMSRNMPLSLSTSKYFNAADGQSPTSASTNISASGEFYAHSSANANASGSGVTDGAKASKTAMRASGISGERDGDGLFQMPAFLFGGLGGSFAPGSGIDALSGSAPLFDFTTGFMQPPQKPWQTTKYYTLSEETHSQDAYSSPAPAPLSAHEKQAASPFAYLHAEPKEHQAAGDDSSASVLEVPVDDYQPAESSTESPPVPSAPPPIDDARADMPAAISKKPYLHVLTAPASSLGLPVYSQSGFDMLSVLGRVATRANPLIALGPVDLTCAFVVSDVRRTDAPIVYASRTFCELTGYTEGEVLGRNCRFLQAPGGRVQSGETRRFTAPDAVRALRFALQDDREVQVSLINYRKDGRPFVNRVSIVPVPAADGASEIAFHVGFQVDLNGQSGNLTQHIQEGQFYSTSSNGPRSITAAERSAKGMGKALRSLLTNETFQAAVTFTPPCNSLNPSTSSSASTSALEPIPHIPTDPSLTSGYPDARDAHQWLHLLLLEHSPDFVHVLSLKGHFLYASPSIQRVFGYAPGELVGRSISDLCHPNDAVPLLRELKEGSLSPGQGAAQCENKNMSSHAASGTDSSISRSSPSSQAQSQPQTQAPSQRTTDLLFRMRTKRGAYVWTECLGRLHVEPGKGRKAIILSGRVCSIPSLCWGAVARAGGLVSPVPSSFTPVLRNDTLVESRFMSEQSEVGAGACEESQDGMSHGEREREFWALLCSDGLFLVASAGVRDVLGWGAGEVIGRALRDFLLAGIDNEFERSNEASLTHILSALGRVCGADCGADSRSNVDITNTIANVDGTQHLTVHMKTRDGEAVWIQVVLYSTRKNVTEGRPEALSDIGARQAIVQFKLLDAHSTVVSSPTSSFSSSFPSSTFSPGDYVPQQNTPYSSQPQYHSQSYTRVSSPPPQSNFPPNFPPHALIPGRILHAHDSNVFAELEAQRGTSWQYELQQLKYANRKLREDIATLEALQSQKQCDVQVAA